VVTESPVQATALARLSLLARKPLEQAVLAPVAVVVVVVLHPLQQRPAKSTLAVLVAPRPSTIQHMVPEVAVEVLAAALAT